MNPNAVGALVERARSGALTWRGPATMLFARSGFAVLAQAVLAQGFALRGSATPWLDAAPWFPVYGTLIDAGCLLVLWRLTRREGIGLFDLVGFDRTRIMRDVLIGIALIPACLVFILGGVYAVGWLVYGIVTPPVTFGSLPLPAMLYGALVFPFIWGLTEQMTYNGYLVPRFRVLGGTVLALVLVGFVWSAQHAVMPLTFDANFVLFRLFSPLPFSVFAIFLYFRLRRLLPLIVAHGLMDSASVLTPLLTA
jgi:hypothetical protein